MKIISVVGARPNFMKIAPFINAINEINSASFPPSGGNPGVRDKGWQGKGVNAVNTASSPTLGGDASVRPEAQEAEGVNSIHAVNTASSLPLGGVRGGFFSVPLPHGIPCCPSKKQKDGITFESE